MLGVLHRARYEVIIFRVVAAGRTDPNELSVPSWQPENIILQVDHNAGAQLQVAQAAEEAEDGGGL